MKAHVLFVEPANYTRDLIANIYQPQGINYSFINSTSTATNEVGGLGNTTHVFSQNTFIKNVSFLWQCSKQNQLIICNGYNHLYFIILWVFSLVNASYVGIESDTPYKEVHGFKGWIKSAYLHTVFANPKVLGLPGGNGLHRDLFLNYGMPTHRIFLLPMMVDNTRYQVVEGKKGNIDKLSFLFVGRLIVEKNLPLLIRAFKAILDKGLAAELVMVGDGDLRVELQNLIGTASEISLAGKKFGSDLSAAYQHADVMVLPSQSESWGLVVNEALAAGLPLICSSAVGAAHDLVVTPDAGWIFENEQDLIDQMEYVIKHPEEIRAKGDRGKAYMLNHWNYELYKAGLNQAVAYANKY